MSRLEKIVMSHKTMMVAYGIGLIAATILGYMLGMAAIA